MQRLETAAIKPIAAAAKKARRYGHLSDMLSRDRAMARPPRWLNLSVGLIATAPRRRLDTSSGSTKVYSRAAFRARDGDPRLANGAGGKYRRRHARRGPNDPRAFSPRAASFAN